MGGWAAVAQIGTQVASSALGASFAQKQAKKAWKRQQQMYKHRYQWQMEDMRKAGLNPILAYRQTPPGTTISGGGPPAGMGSGGAGLASAGVSAKAERRNQRTQGMLLNAQLDLIKGQTFKEYGVGVEANQRALNQRDLLPYMINSADASARAAQFETNLLTSPAGRTMRWIERVKQSIVPWSGRSGRR